jgi:Flp pilus assembly CpaE family ATPase
VTARSAKGLERRDKLSVALVGGDVERRALAAAALAEIREPLLELSERDFHQHGDGAAAPDVVMALFSGNEAEPLAFLQAQAQRQPGPRLVAILEERSAALMRLALHAGAEEILFAPLETDAVTRVLMKVGEERYRRNRRRGVVISVASLSGGAGVTTVAGGLALALAYSLDKVVAVVDLDFQKGGQNIFLNLEPAQTIASLIEHVRVLDSIRLESALCKHPSGVYFLAAPRRFEDGERVSDLAVGAVLDLMAELFDYVVVDCGKRVDENSIAAWERSEAVLYVMEQSFVSAAKARRFRDLFERLRLRITAPHFVLNRADAQHQIGEAAVAAALDAPFYARIPRDERTLQRAQLRAQDIWQVAPNGPLARASADLARRLTTRGGPERIARGLWSRWFGAAAAQA